jgi:hypothetical protein
MRRFIKPIFGILLITTAISLMVFWEIEGRDAVMMQKVMVASQDIIPGTKVNHGMFKEVRILSENMIQNGIDLKQVSSIDGKISNQIILKNSQISKRFFSDSKAEINKGDGIYLIKQDWIFSVSSSLRKGDIIEIYSLDGKTKLGCFKVAFVKDKQGKEVIDEEISDGYIQILNRVNGSEIIDGFEIISNLENYSNILEYIFTQEGKLLIVNNKY